MNNNTISQIDITLANKIDEVDYIENDFVIFDEKSSLPVAHYPSRINAVVIAVCLEGSFRVRVNLQEYEMTKNTLLLTFPEQILQSVNRSSDFAGLFIVISPTFIDRSLKTMKEILPFMFYAKDNPCLPLTFKEVEYIKEYHSLLWSKVKMTDNLYRSEITKGILFSLFYEIYNIISHQMPVQSSPAKSRKEELFKLFMKEVAENYKIERSVSFYANKLCLTPKHLSGVVKEVSGKTAGEWIDNIVILEARALLKSTDMSIQEIAEELSFANQSFFGKYFKHYVGVSPKQYRKS